MPYLKFKYILFIALVLGTLNSCMPYKKPTLSYLDVSSPEHKKEALHSPIYKWIPRKAEQIYFFDLPHWFAWALFGNEDDGIFGEETMLYPDEKADFKQFSYWSFIRNPLHNFTFYIIGTAYLDNDQLTLLQLSTAGFDSLSYRKKDKRVFTEENTGLFLALNGFKPFFSLHLTEPVDFKTYAGWRERGNFGLKLTIESSENEDKNKSSK